MPSCCLSSQHAQQMSFSASWSNARLNARASDRWGCETVWLKAVRTTQGHMAAVAPVLKPWLPEAMAATTVRQ